MFYIETPGYVIWPPTRAEVDKFVVKHSRDFGPHLQKLVIRCGYAREVRLVDPLDEDHAIQFQQVEGTAWEDRIEGLNDYFLPGISTNTPLRNRRGGIYQIAKNKEGTWVGTGGKIPTDYTWVEDYHTTFDIGLS